MPGRFKDYIATPKFNMYQSLHTTVIGPAGRPLEIQIRTEEMHQQAEYGIAAHWLYKQAGNSDGNKQSSAQKFDDQLAWLGRTLDWTQQDDLSDPQEFLNALKIDLFESEVFVFTPKGEVQILRAGSTPLDFAYAVHTEVGNHCVGAQGERLGRAAVLRAADGRPRGDPHAEQRQPLARLAQHREDPLGALQDPQLLRQDHQGR